MRRYVVGLALAGITACGTHQWNYSYDGGLPTSWSQAQFWGEEGVLNPLLPRATMDIYVAP